MSCAVDDSAGSAQTITNDIGSVTISMPSAVQDITGINSTGMERLLLLADLAITLNGPAFNDAANMSHAVFKNFRTILAGQVGRTVTLVHSGQTLAEEIIFTDYQLTRPQDGSLSFSAPGVMSDGTLGGWS